MSEPLLTVRDARKSYGQVQALGGVSFEVGAGEVVALLGPNGAGKSTLIRCLTTLLKPDGGTFSMAGTDVVADPAAARGHFGYAGQEGSLDKLMTGAEMLRFQAGLVHLPRAEAQARAAALLSRFGLAEVAGRAVETYSGGMKRRLDLACALLHRPRVLILDEPSTGLDYEARLTLWALLGELKREGVAILLATHDFEEADLLASRCVLLSRGRVAGCGSPQELREALGESVIGAALHDHPRAGDRERLAAIFAGIPGTALPPIPGGAEYAKAVPAARGGNHWLEEIRAEASRKNLTLTALGLRRPTLQDAYLAATSGAEAA